MNIVHNIYCDESCHLEAPDTNQRFMVLGGLACPIQVKEEIFQRIKTIRKENGINTAEMKWTKVSEAKKEAYRDIINYFFDKNELYFRAVVINKDSLDHGRFSQDHDLFYYKMYFQLLDWFMGVGKTCNVFLDIKDTQGVEKTKKLHEVLCNNNHDFNKEMVANIQEVRSHEVVLMQVVDLLIGAISYANRFPDGGKSAVKNNLVSLIKERAGSSLVRSTVLGERKFNVFCWEGR
jgi:hypothetical protein